MTLVLATQGSGARAAETYQYDAIGRLTDMAYANGGSLHYTYDANGNVLSETTSLATAVEDASAPLRFSLGPATPNPGGSIRNLYFTLPARAHVTLRVFDVAGRLKATLVDHDHDAGRHDVRFFTERWATGVYYYRLESAGRVRAGRLVVLR
jgi:YD repeat-containing protein